MAQLRLQVGGRGYDLACRDGEEEKLRALARMVDAKVAEAARAVGVGNEARVLLLAGLLLADELAEARSGTAPDPLAPFVEALADRLEKLATRLEHPSASD